MRKILLTIMFFMPVFAFSQGQSTQGQSAYETHLLSESQKATCSPEQLKSLYNDLDKDSNELNEMIEKMAKYVGEKKGKIKDDSWFADMKRGLDEKTKVVAGKESFIYENCKVVYKSPKARYYEEQAKQERLEEQKNYDPSEAYNPDLAPKTAE